MWALRGFDNLITTKVLLLIFLRKRDCFGKLRQIELGGQNFDRIFLMEFTFDLKVRTSNVHRAAADNLFRRKIAIFIALSNDEWFFTEIDSWHVGLDEIFFNFFDHSLTSWCNWKPFLSQIKRESQYFWPLNFVFCNKKEAFSILICFIRKLSATGYSNQKLEI